MHILTKTSHFKHSVVPVGLFFALCSEPYSPDAGCRLPVAGCRMPDAYFSYLCAKFSYQAVIC
jgi:hypothetical protein